MLEADQVSVRRGAATILQSVSARVRPGEVLGIVGPNGAGKSTLMRILAGLEVPDEGRVLFEGADLARFDRRERARRIAYLPQSGPIEGSITVRELVGLGRLPHGGDTARDRDTVERAMRVTDVLRLQDRVAATLSGGERARALVARAMAVEAPCLLADEPGLSLDPRHELALMAQFRAAAAAGQAIAIVLHDLTLAARFCDRLLLLSEGRAIGEGPWPAVLSGPAIRTAFGIEAVTGEHRGEPYIVPWRIAE